MTLACHVALMQGAEVTHAQGEELADLQAMFVIHEHGRVGLTPGDVNFRYQAEALAQDDGRGNVGVTDSGEVGRGRGAQYP